jgi:hypothetical protein
MDLHTQAPYGSSWYPEVVTSMMHFIKSDVTILGKYNEELGRDEGKSLE